jgi:NYN domain
LQVGSVDPARGERLPSTRTRGGPAGAAGGTDRRGQRRRAARPALLAEIASYGTAQVRRAYGDWTSPNLAAWRGELLAHSIQHVQQFAYTAGKNATDAAMIIDAMDLLHTGRFDGFCLVSSDSDFTPLARRLRESGAGGRVR